MPGHRLLRGVGVAVAIAALSGCSSGAATGLASGSGASAVRHSTDNAGTSTGSDPVVDPGAYFEAINDAMQGVGSYQMDVSVSAAEQAGNAADIAMSVVVADTEKSLAKITMAMPAEELGDPSGGGMVDIVVITTHDMVYMQYPPEIGLTGPDEWVSVDLASDMGAQIMGDLNVDVVNPELMASFGDDLEATMIEADPIEGVAMSEVRVTLTAEEFVSGLLGEDAPDTAAAPFEEIDYVLTVGEDLLVRQIDVQMGEFITMTAVVSDFGAEHAVEIPAAADTIAFEDLIDDTGVLDG